jgi:hypothetical protein
VGGVRHPQHTQTFVCAPDDGWKYHPKHVRAVYRYKQTV